MSCCRSRIRFRICAWIDTSSADTGSSATIMLGRRMSARRQPEPLPLAAGELVRVAVQRRLRQPDAHPASRRPAASCSCRLPMRWITSGSRRIVPTRILGSMRRVGVLEHELDLAAAPPAVPAR